MKVKRLLLPLAIALALPSMSQASYVYSYDALPFTIVDSWLNTNGNLHVDQNHFSFTFDNALGANLVNQSVAAQVTGWDAMAINTPKSRIGSDVANSTINTLKFSTNALGQIIDWSIYLTGFTDDIYGSGILGQEIFTASPETDALTFMNPPGRSSWLSSYRGGAYGLAYCMGFSCIPSNNGPWIATRTGAETPAGSSLPEPETLSLIGLGLAGLGFVRRRAALLAPRASDLPGPVDFGGDGDRGVAPDR